MILAQKDGIVLRFDSIRKLETALQIRPNTAYLLLQNKRDWNGWKIWREQ